MRAWSCFVVVGALAGCVGHTIDAGTNDAGPARSIGTDGSSVPSSGISAEVFRGDVDGAMFDVVDGPTDGAPGPTTVVMTLAFSSSAVTGTVFFGDGPPLAPPTNPDVGYPAGYTGVGYGPLPRKGYPFTVLKGTVDGSRVTLQVNTKELYAKWCELQTMTYRWPGYAGSVYGCMPQGGGSLDPESDGPLGCITTPQEGAPMPIDCVKAMLCGSADVCTCSATGCTRTLSTAPDVPLGDGPVQFVMERTGDAMNGTVVGLHDSVEGFNVHMTRAN
jgi:hypothetical protein